MTLDDFFKALGKHEQRVPLDELTTLITQLEVTSDDVADYIQFGKDTYRRNLLHEGPGYQALVLCWKNGQRSPIHDHRGSSCGVRVLRGVATETVFQRGRDGMLMATRTHVLRTGEVCGSEDADIHQVSNLQKDGSDLVTLHVYTPPLLKMSTYSLTDNVVREFEEPIYEFVHGSGI
jgi:cysteine dioxygenase